MESNGVEILIEFVRVLDYHGEVRMLRYTYSIV